MAKKGILPKNLAYLHSLPRTPEWRRKIGLKSKGRKHTEETKRKCGLANKGKKLTAEHKAKISKNNARYWLGKKRPNLFSKKWRKEQSERLKGHKVSEETIKRMSRLNKGKFGKEHPASEEKHPLWKGNKVGYDALHSWVERRLGKPDTCEHCLTSDLTGKKIHWANKSGNYLRDLKDWLRLCASCHKKYDLI